MEWINLMMIIPLKALFLKIYPFIIANLEGCKATMEIKKHLDVRLVTLKGVTYLYMNMSHIFHKFNGFPLLVMLLL